MIIKSCGHCAKELPEHFKLGEICPHCHLKVVHERHHLDDTDLSTEIKSQFISKFIGIIFIIFALGFFIFLTFQKSNKQTKPFQNQNKIHFEQDEFKK